MGWYNKPENHGFEGSNKWGLIDQMTEFFK